MVRNLLMPVLVRLPECLKRRIRCLGVSFVVRLTQLRMKSYSFYGTPNAPRAFKKYISDDTVHWIDPERVVYITTPKQLDIHEYRGRVIPGDWDTLVDKFDDLDFYVSYQERILKGTRWEDSPYYKNALESIGRGIPVWGCGNRAALDTSCRALDRVFENIKLNGYKSQSLLEEEKRTLLDLEDEISVNIGRHGDPLFNNGRHRLAFAKILRIEKIPVRITGRHYEWEVFKKGIELYAGRNSGRVYAPLTHFDLQAIPSLHSHERFEMIRDNVGEGSRTLLDIGAHWGYFCHKFEDAGYECSAVETDGEHLHFLRKLRRAENRKFEIIPESIFSLCRKGPLKYNVVLALSIFHHFLKDDNSFRKLRSLLESMDVDEMYFQPHLRDDPQMEGAVANLSPEGFVDYILRNSCLGNHRLIGECSDGRPLYALWR